MVENMEWFIGVGKMFAAGFFLTTIIIYALFFMIEESTSISLKIICGLVGGAGLFIFFNL
ncbi:MAG: hypothetical protein O2849_06450 [Proteobacteria bacterium]|nr:hypothetical protein [Pseudomonadota bacterium]